MPDAVVGRPPTGPGHYLRDAVYGANDGVITTLAVVSGVEGAAFPPIVAIVLGLANLAADGLSMGASNYLGLKSELEQTGASVAEEKPVRHAFATFLAFILAGAVPLLALLVPVGPGLGRFAVAMALALVALGAIGAARAAYLPSGALRAGLEMALVGGGAGLAAFAIGRIVGGLAA
ncbi:MAG TPA: VIT1/CCC1 transporter family protein [Candidatus Thermoplasmatota archaeon]|nr:VIT1/CCC1 transporter family protein [Candidatus Thermoplasmatota archaeon]